MQWKLRCVTQFTLSPKQLDLQMLLASTTLSILESHWDSSQISCWCPCVMEKPAVLVLHCQCLHMLQQFLMLGWMLGWILGWTNSKPWIWAWLVDELFGLPALICLWHQDQLLHFVQAKDGASSPTLHRQGKGPVLLCLHPWSWLK